MKIVNFRCDGCPKETDDFSREIDWLEISTENNRSLNAMVSGGHNYQGKPQVKRMIGRMHDLHFCCPECLVNYFYKK
jgi:hypothetical protein